MTEIALALAMAFFAIMILTLVSMSGQDRVIQVNQIKTTSEQIRLLAPEGQASQGKGKARVLQARDLIIFTGGRFFDDKLQPLDRARMAAMKEPVLAVAPRLSLAFLLYLAFGSVQAAITTALQFHPGQAVAANLLACGTAEPYAERRALYEKLHGHLERLEKAAYHALRQDSDGDVISLSDHDSDRMFQTARRDIDQGGDIDGSQLAALEVEAAKAFKQIARRGFEAEALGRADRREGFRVGAGVLYTVGQVLDGYLGGLERLEQDGGLEAQFRLDTAAFSPEFGKLYGVSDDRDLNAR